MEDRNMQTVGYRIKKLRKKHGYTQKDLANYLNTSQSYIAKLENNKLQLSSKVLKKLSLLYNCNEEYISEGIEDEIRIFKSNVKNLNLNTVVKMNKIIKNIEYLSDLTEDID